MTWQFTSIYISARGPCDSAAVGAGAYRSRQRRQAEVTMRITSALSKGLAITSNTPWRRASAHSRSSANWEVTIRHGGAERSLIRAAISRQAPSCQSASKRTMGIRCSRKAANAEAWLELLCRLTLQLGYRVTSESRKVCSKIVWSSSAGPTDRTVIVFAGTTSGSLGSGIGPKLLPNRKTTPRLSRCSMPASDFGEPITNRSHASAPVAVRTK